MIKEGVVLGGRYEIIERIGMGGMADVYKAVDRVLRRYVAVKVLKREFREDENFVKKFQSEAQSAAMLTHPNIVNVYDVAEDRGVYFIVMELVEGITLKDYIHKKGQLTAKEVVGITVQVCAAIDVAHSHGIVHRDIKPQNIIISKEGKVKVTDFGIAKATSSNTISTNAMGSVHYTSPEQARGGFSDAKSDVYSLGITMYEMVTGKLPFDGDSTVSIALKHLQEDMVAPSEFVPDMPYSLESIILKCTQKSPDRRYASMAALIRDLKRSLAEPDGDFVTIAPFVSAADTVMISQEELSQIKAKSSYKTDRGNSDYDENYDDEDYDSPRARKRGSRKSEIDPKMAKIMKILTIAVAVIFVFILVYAIGSAAGLLKFGPGIQASAEEQLVPGLVGMTQEEAEDLCKEIGCELNILRYEESEEFEEGYIMQQMRQEGSKVEKGTLIPVVVSSGLVKKVEVPSVEGMSQEAAKAKLIEAGFLAENITVQTKPDDKIAIEKAVGTNPDAGELVNVNSKIILYMSSGKGDTLVPNLLLKTADVAAELLELAGLKGEMTEAYDPTIPAGRVISQDKDYGTTVDPDTVIKYVVSKGPEMVKIPTGLAGGSYSSVKAQLMNLGLEVTEKYAESSSYAEGYVISVAGEGTEVKAGTSVVVTISTGAAPVTPPPSTPTNPPSTGDGSGEGSGEGTGSENTGATE